VPKQEKKPQGSTAVLEVLIVCLKAWGAEVVSVILFLPATIDVVPINVFQLVKAPVSKPILAGQSCACTRLLPIKKHTVKSVINIFFKIDGILHYKINKIYLTNR
jgi:hypothetical protein